MKAGKNPAQEKENIETETIQQSPIASKPAASLLPDAGFSSNNFGTWGDNRPESLPQTAEATPAKPITNKKSSRFASMFAPKEEPRQVVDTPVSPGPLAAFAANGSTEDREGFQRMLSMLRGTTMAPPGGPAQSISSPNAQTPSNNLFDSGFSEDKGPGQAPRSAQQPGLEALFGKPSSKQQSRPASTMHAQSPLGPAQGSTQAESRQQPNPPEMQSIFLDQPGPRRNVSTPEAQNIQSLLAGQRPSKTPALNKDSEFLLNLIQTKNASRPPSQAARPPEQDNFQLFLDQPPKQPAQTPQSRGPPPMSPPQGFPPTQPFQHRDQRPNADHNQAPRQSMPRPPPGFFEDPNMMHSKQQQQQQHQPPPPPFSSHEPQSPQSRRPLGMPPPPGFAPHVSTDHPFFGSGGVASPNNERLPPGPPPGFGPPGMRHTQPYANIPTSFPQPHGQHPHGASGLPPSQQMQTPLGSYPHHHPANMPPQQHQQRPGPPGLTSPHEGPPNGPAGGPAAFAGIPPPPGFFSAPPPQSHHGGPFPPGFGGPLPPGLQAGMGPRGPVDGFGGGMGQGQAQGPGQIQGVRSPLEMFGLGQQGHGQGQTRGR